MNLLQYFCVSIKQKAYCIYMKTICALFLFSLFFTNALPQTIEDKTDEKLIYLVNEAKVETTSNQFIKPDFVIPVNGRVFVQDQIVIISNQVVITAINPNDNKKIWEIVNNPGVISSIEKMENGILFSQTYQIGYPNHTLIQENEINRYKLATGEKLKPLIIENNVGKQLICIASKNNFTVILGSKCIDAKNSFEKVISNYSITLFQNDTGKIVWQKEFETEGQSSPESFKLFYKNEAPPFSKPSINKLNILDDEIVVCAGNQENIISLNIKDGSQKWAIKNIWEFQRGKRTILMGSYFISRYGIDYHYEEIFKKNKNNDYLINKKNEIDAQVNQAKDSFQNSKITGGPFIVNTDKTDYRAFVTVTRISEQYATKVSECILYELNRSGKPISMITLPYAVAGSNVILEDKGIILQIQEIGFAKILPTENSFKNKNIINKCISNLDWFYKTSANQELEVTFEKSWLSWGNNKNFIEYSGTTAIINFKGGFIENMTSSIINLPFYTHNISNKQNKNFILKIPYAGKIYYSGINNLNISYENNLPVHHHSNKAICIVIQKIYHIKNKIIISIQDDKYENYLFIFPDNGITN